MNTIRKANQADIDSIEKIYQEILEEESKGTVYTNWKKDVYPIRETAEKALEEKTLYVLLADEKVVAAANLNQIQLPEYENIKWNQQAKPEEVLVIHTLVVSPKEKRKGYGEQFVRYAIQYGKDNGFKTLRIDTYEGNLPACRMYESIGFEYAGETDFDFHSILEVLKCYDYDLQ